jgi:hypothetical protein
MRRSHDRAGRADIGPARARPDGRRPTDTAPRAVDRSRSGPAADSGSQVEIDVAAFESDRRLESTVGEDQGGVARAVWAPPEPIVAVQTTLAEFEEYKVRVLDARRGRRPVAAIEIVGPAN